jgi:hypothetical protein
MIRIQRLEYDDPEYINHVECILTNLIAAFDINEVYLVKIDHWFDFKWYSFSGKSLGAVGVRHKTLRLPPFVPERVERQQYFSKIGDSFKESSAGALHIHQHSDANFNRKIENISDSAIFLWYSGGTKQALRGSVMFYGTINGNEPSWYISFLKKTSWQIYKTEDISRREARELLNNVAA